MRKKPSAISTFLTTTQGFDKPKDIATPTLNAAKDQTKNIQKQADTTQEKVKTVEAKTTPTEVEGAGGQKFVTTAYTAQNNTLATGTKEPVVQAAPTTVEALSTYTPTVTDYNALGTQAKTAGAVNIDEQSKNINTVRQTFFDKGEAEAAKMYKELFGEELTPEKAAAIGVTGKGLTSINDYLKDTSKTFGNVGQQSLIETGAEKDLANITDGKPTSNLSALSGMFNLDSRLNPALESQAFNNELQDLKTQAGLAQAGKVGAESSRTQSIKDFLRTQAQGKENVDAYKKDVETKTLAQGAELKKINDKAVDDLIKTSNNAETDASKTSVAKSLKDLVGNVDDMGFAQSSPIVKDFNGIRDTIRKISNDPTVTSMGDGRIKGDNLIKEASAKLQKLQTMVDNLKNKGLLDSAEYDKYIKALGRVRSEVAMEQDSLQKSLYNRFKNAHKSVAPLNGDITNNNNVIKAY